MKHTKSQWKWKQNRGNNYYEHSVFVRDGMSDKVIAELSGMGCTKEEVKDNAHLIADAPDLLKMCQALLGAMPPALQKKWPNIVRRAKKLIADRA